MTEQPQPSKEEIVEALTTLRSQMLSELGNEYVAGMEQAFKICIDGLNRSANDPRIANSQFGPGIAIAVDTLKALKADAIKPFVEANSNALKNNTAFEAHTGETKNG